MADLLELHCGDGPQAWEALGFTVTGGRCRIGAVDLVLDGAGGGLRGWTLSGAGPGDVDGLPTAWAAAPRETPAPGHPNGASALDHVVVFTDDRDRTARALESAGGDVRRRRDPPAVPLPMAFVRFGATIVEVAQTPDGPARFWGLVVIVPDLDALASRLGARLGAVKGAVQPGRRIATARPAPGFAVPLAFMTPR